MADFLPQTGRELEIGRGHEPNVVRAKDFVLFAGGLVVVIAISGLALLLMMQYFAARGRELTALAPPRFGDSSPPFPAPRLQPDPAAELIQMRDQELRRLNGYGWVDQKAGIAHIPIERAMEVIAKSGIPPVEPPAAAAMKPAGTASSGASATTKAPSAKSKSERDKQP